MSLSVVPGAAQSGKSNLMKTETEVAIMATSHGGKCFRQPVLSVAKQPKYHSSPEAASRYIATTATIKLE